MGEIEKKTKVWDGSDPKNWRQMPVCAICRAGETGASQAADSRARMLERDIRVGQTRYENERDLCRMLMKDRDEARMAVFVWGLLVGIGLGGLLAWLVL